MSKTDGQQPVTCDQWPKNPEHHLHVCDVKFEWVVVIRTGPYTCTHICMHMHNWLTHMHIYMHMIHMHVHMHNWLTYMHMHIHNWLTHMHMHDTCIIDWHTHMHNWLTHMHMHMYTQMHSHMQINCCTHTHAHAWTDTNWFTHIHKHMHSHMHNDWCTFHGTILSVHWALQITSEKLAILDCNCFIKSTTNWYPEASKEPFYCILWILNKFTQLAANFTNETLFNIFKTHLW